MAKEPYRAPAHSNWVPGWNECRSNGFTWVSDLLKLETFEGQLAEAKEKLKTHRQAPIGKAEFVEGLRKAFESYEQARIVRLARLLGGYAFPGRPGSFFSGTLFNENPHDRKEPPVLSWSDIEAAVELMAFHPNALCREEREEALTKLKQEIHKLEESIEKNRAPWLRKDNNLGLIDIRKAYVDYWRKTQNDIDGACDARGYELAGGPDGEVEAYEMLDIRSWQYPKSVYEPHPRPQMGN